MNQLKKNDLVMNSLPRYSNRLDAGMSPYAPDSSTLRHDANGYPGSVPYLTSEFLQNESVINKNVGRPTNGSIRTSVLTRTRDQNSINVNQFAFMDTSVVDRPVLHNIQSLNWWLVNNKPGGGYNTINDNKQLEKYLALSSTGVILNRNDAQKSYIMDRFKLYGVVANRDVDGASDDFPRERVSRDFTCTVKGVCHVLDYWSYDRNLVAPYSLCYFVLKKIKITDKMTWQHKLTNGTYKGDLHADKAVVGKYCWQIIPFHCSDNAIPADDLMWKDDNGKKHKGAYWRCGYIHEYPDVGSYQQYEKRLDAGLVSRNITYLHDRGRVTPVHFYLKLGDNFN